MYYAQIYSTRNAKVLHKMRKEIVLYALHHGIRAAAREFKCSRNTVRFWLRRYLEDPKQKLIDRRPSTTNHPAKMETEYQELLCDTVRRRRECLQRVIAAQLRRTLCIPYSSRTCIKVLRRHGLFRTRHTKKVQKQDLRARTNLLRFAQRIQIDIKFLCDIPEIKGGVLYGYLPKYQITARDCATGALWFAYSNTKSTTDTTLFIELLMTHLRAYGIDLATVTFQTDNGKEFTTWFDSARTTLFAQAIERYYAHHRTIPFGSPTHNSMVEASHRLIEDECYGNMHLPIPEEFFQTVTEYQEHFNFTRYNSYRKGSPYMLLVEKAPEIDPAVLSLAPVRVDTLLTKERLATWRSWQDEVP